MGGWRKSQDAEAERNLLVVIPGRNRREAVVMADHYDTAYMHDRYHKDEGGCGARLAACGADDNYSATAAMMLAAPIFLRMNRAGKLGCDVWLVHLTGEEFPADSLGARALIERLVERTLKLSLPRGKLKDLSKTLIRGVYVSDMIAHNNNRERDIFQISLGNDPASMWLAYRAHLANETWNESVPYWNKSQGRDGLPRAPQSVRRRRSGGSAVSPTCWPGARALGPAEHSLQHRRADVFRRRCAVRTVHGELRHQSQRVSRHARHHGEHRPGLRGGPVRDHDRGRGAGGHPKGLAPVTSARQKDVPRGISQEPHLG
jgi:hypothetical protein